uniref:Protein giant-lens n=1 Tax=Clastoptera arizonana TaxID=38151 RepID=A0A1B6C8E4_9HEMI
MTGIVMIACRMMVAGLFLVKSSTESRLPPLVYFQHHRIHHHNHAEEFFDDANWHTTVNPEYNSYSLDARPLRVLYQVGDSEEDLPVCQPWAVCSKVDKYESPWIERQCRCPGQHKCSSQLASSDGHTLVDKTRHFKLCEPVKKLTKCRYFRDITWVLTSGPDNTTQQVVNCHCPKGAVAYLIKQQAFQNREGQFGYQYSFACSPQGMLRCQRKEPCRLFTVRKRLELLDEVNTNGLCQCPHNHYCPRHHTDPGVIQLESFVEENIRTYSGYCLPDGHLYGT